MPRKIHKPTKQARRRFTPKVDLRKPRTWRKPAGKISAMDKLVAEFLSKGGRVNRVAPAPTYGINREFDKASRARRLAEAEYLKEEHRAERRTELAREFASVGDHQGAIDAASGMFDKD